MAAKDLRIKRGSLKGRLTRFASYLDGVDVDSPDIIQLKNRIVQLEPVLDQFEQIQIELELLEPEDSDNHDRERLNFENDFYDLTARAQAIIINSTTQNAACTSAVPSTQIQNDIKLPSLNLASFDGSINEWLFFKETFESIIDSNTQLSDIHKFHYLRLALKGEAAEVIKSLEISGASYKIAWALLTERYQNKRLLINNHIQAIFNLPVMARENSAALRQILDGAVKHTRSLQNLNEPIDHWDTLLIYILSNKLDSGTRRAWEAANTNVQMPTFKDFQQFLKDKCVLLETLHGCEAKQVNNNTSKFKVKTHLVTEGTQEKCPLCKGEHCLQQCSEFSKFNQAQRLEQVRKLKLCINCMKNNHIVLNCRSNSTCRKCHKRHHTLLHREQAPSQTENSNAEAKEPTNNSISDSSSQVALSTSFSNRSLILLSTASVQVSDSHGNKHKAKVLLDSGSQASFITQNLFDKLNLKKSTVNVAVSGINQNALSIDSRAEIEVGSIHSDFVKTISCLIIPKIASLTAIPVDISSLAIPKNISLADPEFNKDGEIDILIGADTFWQLTCVGQIRLGSHLPILQKTNLGWIISGELPLLKENKISCNFNQIIENQLRKFWEMEECSLQNKHSLENDSFEMHFTQNTMRDSDGKFIVKIPLKLSDSLLGESKSNALKRLEIVERKLEKDNALKTQYQDFIREYIALNHMTKLEEPIEEANAFYLPHHCVIKSESLTTKLRVVFDGSAKSSTGYSINDLQMTGSNMQDELFSIVIRFRLHSVVISADITKMYRQVWIDKDQRRLQRILWRNQANEKVDQYELNTITYGLVSSSFLAIRCLYELAHEFEGKYPQSSSKVKSDFYVDDLLTGGETIDEVRTVISEISEILGAGGFHLNKWVSNKASLLSDISDTNPKAIINIGEDNSTKALGLIWRSEPDTLNFSVGTFSVGHVTKRSILSLISRIFDPLGLLGPVNIIGKMLLQQLWLCKVNWDESVPQHIYTAWNSFYSQLHHLNEVNFPRQVICERVVEVELHGFSDASQTAYGAVIYLRSLDSHGKFHTHILCSKTRVSPLKVLTIPRLELSGALLLARLFERVKSSLPIAFNNIYLWCDSTIVLSWIKSESRNWKVFVANRISEIQKLTCKSNWNHVKSADNPADLLTRGVSPKSFKNSKLWFNGPHWLQQSSSYWPNEPMDFIPTCKEYENELRNKGMTLVAISNESFDLINKFSTLTKLTRVTAYCLRFSSNSGNARDNRKTGPITVKELNDALQVLIKISQRGSFGQEINELAKDKPLSKSNKLCALSPFIDSSGILRVGGRLQNTDYNYSKKHPIILSAKCNLSKLLVEREHLQLLHAGAQLVLASLRNEYWIVAARNLVKKVVRSCVRCYRFNCKNTEYKMGNLPTSRVTASRPFANCGIDYAGPFLVRPVKSKRSIPIKIYLCLIVCFATKATHLELVSDLSTEGFLAALRRFTSRRGKPENIYSDNGKNFIGAITELRKLLNNNLERIQNALSAEKISWHLIPPRAPHFGGIWEAAVKSAKHHIRRVVGNTILTYEDFNTLVIQIEGILNSRPLCPLSDDPQDMQPLTPAHFLIGQSLTQLPEENLEHVKDNSLSRFQRIQSLKQGFWRRWSNEYLSELQIRSKWKASDGSEKRMERGALVLVKEDGVPPQRWVLARIVDLHPGSDGVVRVATIKTVQGIYKRPLVKLCQLPVD